MKKGGRLLKSNPEFYSRRQFLSIGKKAIFVVGISSLYPVGRFLTSKDERLVETRVAGKELNINSNWQQVGQTRFWLREGNNGVEAIWASCTHLGCEVNYDLEQDQWLCPCHGSRYSKEGLPIQGPAISPLARANIKEKNGYYILTQPAGGA